MSETKQPSFYKQLNDTGYFCTEEFADVVENALHKKPMSITMLRGKAGTGKSYLPEKIAEVLKCNIYVKQAFKDYEWDDFVQKYVPDETTTSGFSARDCEVLLAIKESKDKRVVLLLDEWDKTQHSADGMFLEFLQSGRISVAGTEYKANLDNLIIFFTGNDDRTFSEPFIRRMKFIEVEHMPPSLILQILNSKYKGNKEAEKMFNAVINLYNASIIGDMDKPATVQELMDVINDWVRYKSIGKNPRWEELIYTNVTKGRRNHTELQNALAKIKNGEIDSDSEFSKSLDIGFFDKEADVEADKIANGFGSMPRMMDKLNINIEYGAKDAVVGDENNVYAEYKRDEAVYTNAYEESIDNEEDINQPHFISWYTVRNSSIERSKAYELREIIEEEKKFLRLRNSEGTLVFVEDSASKSDVGDFLELTENTAYIRKATNNEIIFRVTLGHSKNHQNNVEYNARWTKGSGCEFIVPTNALDMFRETIRTIGWYVDGKDRLRLDNICIDLEGNHLDTRRYINVRKLGNSKKILDVVVSGEMRTNDELSYHSLIYKSVDVKVKETKRTTTYELGWATVRSWHLKDRPNYKNHVVIKSAPASHINIQLHLMFIQKKLGCNSIPLFVNMNKDLYLKMPTLAEGGKWKVGKSTRLLQDTSNKNLNIYCVNTFANTTFIAMLKPSMDNITELIDWRNHMLFTRKKMEEVNV